MGLYLDIWLKEPLASLGVPHFFGKELDFGRTGLGKKRY
jgi:hypothetical protein